LHDLIQPSFQLLQIIRDTRIFFFIAIFQITQCLLKRDGLPKDAEYNMNMASNGLISLGLHSILRQMHPSS